MYGLMIRVADFFSTDPYRGNADGTGSRHKILARPQPGNTYCIFFTPRSGSTHLKDLLSSTNALGHPREIFNPNVLSKLAQSVGARSLDEYADLTGRNWQNGGTAGFEITFRHVLYAFKNQSHFFRIYSEGVFFWLIREDIVAQAVSASRLRQTRVSSTVVAGPAAARNSEDVFRYRPAQIRRYIRRLRWIEKATERFFRAHDIAPVRLSYELLTRTRPNDLCQVFADRTGTAIDPKVSVSSRYTKLESAKAVAFTKKFRASHTRWLRRVEAERSAMISAVGDGLVAGLPDIG